MAEWRRAVGEDVGSQDEGAPDAVDRAKSSPRTLFRTTSPSVITMEPQPGDEKVFGDAWPLVDEWRLLRERHPFEGKGLAWLEDEERLRQLEIELGRGARADDASRHQPLGQPEPADAGPLAHSDIGAGAQGAGPGADQAEDQADSDLQSVAELGSWLIVGPLLARSRQ